MKNAPHYTCHKAIGRLGQLLNPLLRCILPCLCPACLSAQTQNHLSLCDVCTSGLRELPTERCVLCGGAADGVLNACGECLQSGGRPWDNAVSVFAYGGQIRRLIHRFKYHGGTCLTPWLAHRMTANWRQYGQIGVDAVAPVPMHPAKQMLRGYNQAALLARAVANSLQLPVVQPLCRRRLGRQQSLLDFSRRRINVRDVFATRPGVCITGRRILLVDDVMTTGATLTAATTILLEQHGAAAVAVLTAARG